MSLEAAAVSARGGFACMFSSSEEFETALISERRAQGRYDQRRTRWPAIMFVGCCADGRGHGAAVQLSWLWMMLMWAPRGAFFFWAGWARHGYSQQEAVTT